MTSLYIRIGGIAPLCPNTCQCIQCIYLYACRYRNHLVSYSWNAIEPFTIYENTQTLYFFS